MHPTVPKAERSAPDTAGTEDGAWQIQLEEECGVRLV